MINPTPSTLRLPAFHKPHAALSRTGNVVLGVKVVADGTHGGNDPHKAVLDQGHTLRRGKRAREHHPALAGHNLRLHQRSHRRGLVDRH